MVVLAVPAFADTFAAIDELTRDYEERGDLNGAVLVAQDGRVVFKKGFGLANREWGIPNEPDTKFRIGSITKQFTAALILQLVDEGVISLDDTVVEHLPFYREDTGSKITIHHLLTHSSGLPNYTADKRFRDEAMRDPFTMEDFAKGYCSGELEFEPGSVMRYSNSGYYLLGVIIEYATDFTYSEQLQKRILEPLDMSDTGYDDFESILERRAAGYEKQYDYFVNANYLDMSLPYSAGAMYSTVEDLYRWDQALYDDTVLSGAMKQKMFTPYKNDYGYGWRVVEMAVGEGADEKRTAISHGGGINGFSSYIVRVPEDRNLVVVLNNFTQGPSGQLAEEILALLYAAE